LPVVKVYGPFGNCSYENWLPLSTLLIAVGSGFAQVQAWLEAASLAQHSRLIHLYWIVRNEQDQYQIERLQQWQTELSNFHYELIYTTKIEQSVINVLQLSLQSRYPNLNDYQVYASGPPQLVHEIKDALRACCNLEHFYADV
jgi:aquacobalamin reductase/NAD(P)H-flavin reductase